MQGTTYPCQVIRKVRDDTVINKPSSLRPRNRLVSLALPQDDTEDTKLAEGTLKNLPLRLSKV